MSERPVRLPLLHHQYDIDGIVRLLGPAHTHSSVFLRVRVHVCVDWSGRAETIPPLQFACSTNDKFSLQRSRAYLSPSSISRLAFIMTKQRSAFSVSNLNDRTSGSKKPKKKSCSAFQSAPPTFISGRQSFVYTSQNARRQSIYKFICSLHIDLSIQILLLRKQIKERRWKKKTKRHTRCANFWIGTKWWFIAGKRAVRADSMWTTKRIERERERVERGNAGFGRKTFISKQHAVPLQSEILIFPRLSLPLSRLLPAGTAEWFVF